MKIKYVSFILLVGILLFSCSKAEDEETCETTDITYTNTVSAIFDSSCALAGCHVAGNEMIAFFSLEDYENAKIAADFGRIVGAISHEEGFSVMPPSGVKLDQCNIDKIAAWVDAGAPE